MVWYFVKHRDNFTFYLYQKVSGFHPVSNGYWRRGSKGAPSAIISIQIYFTHLISSKMDSVFGFFPEYSSSSSSSWSRFAETLLSPASHLLPKEAKTRQGY
jgi:hypothetical protein